MMRPSHGVAAYFACIATSGRPERLPAARHASGACAERQLQPWHEGFTLIDYRKSKFLSAECRITTVTRVLSTNTHHLSKDFIMLASSIRLHMPTIVVPMVTTLFATVIVMQEAPVAKVLVGNSPR